MRDALLACTTREDIDTVLHDHGLAETSSTAQAVGGVDYEHHTITAAGFTITFRQYPVQHDSYGSADPGKHPRVSDIEVIDRG